MKYIDRFMPSGLTRVAALIAVVLSAGCASHGTGIGMLPMANAPAANALRAGSPGLVATLDFRPQDLANFAGAFPNLEFVRDRTFHRLDSGTAKQLICYGYLYPSYVSTKSSLNEQFINHSGSTYKATISFNDVPKGNNEFAVFQFYQPGTTGSQVFVGSLAAIVNNPGAVTLKVTVTSQTTLVFQAEIALVNAGLLDAKDLTDTKLAATIAKSIKGLKPSDQTGLFTNGQLAAYVNSQNKTWGRTLTVTAKDAQEIAVSNDTTNVAEADLAYNSKNFLDAGNVAPRPPGAPCISAVATHAPGKTPAVSSISCAYIVGTSSGKLSFPVYGDSIVVGASNGVAPYKGITQVVPSRTPGSKASITLAALKASNISINTSDPFDWAFGTFPTLTLNAGSGSQFATVANFYPNWAYGKTKPAQFSVPSNYAPAHSAIDVNSWNPFGLTPAQLQLCDPTSRCQTVTNSKTFAINTPFADPGTAASYFNWKGTGGTKITTLPGCTGYTVTPAGGTVTLTSSRATLLTTDQQLTLVFSRASSVCGKPPLVGSTFDVKAVGTDGTPYEGTGMMTPGTFPTAIVTMNSYLALTAIKSVSITSGNVSSGTTPVNLQTIRSAFTP